MTEEEEKKKLDRARMERDRKNRRAKRIAKKFPHLMWGEVAIRLDDYKTERGLLAALDKRNTKAEKQHAAPVPDTIEVDVEWRKSRIWGYCPVATARAYRDSLGWWSRTRGRAGGCGYDKHSAVLADVLNPLLCSLLWTRRKGKWRKKENHPYGVSYYSDGFPPTLEGGVGVNSTIDCMKWLGYDVLHKEGKTWDSWTFTQKVKRSRKQSPAVAM